MATPQRYAKGVTNVAKGTTMGMFVDMDPSKCYGVFEDFFRYDAANTNASFHWKLTTLETGAGSATEAVSDTEAGGALVVTNAAAITDADSFQWSKEYGTTATENFLFVAGKQAWFKCRFKGNDVDQSMYVLGLHIIDTTPTASDPSDGIWFGSDDGDSYVDLHVCKGSSETETEEIASLVDDTYISLGFHYDGKAKVEYYVNDAYVGSSVVTNLPDDEALSLSFAFGNGEAVANTMTIDYIGAWMER